MADHQDLPKRISRQEVLRMQARLAELEATTVAIRNGEVDAIMVNGPKGCQVYTLQSAEEPYRVFAEQMNEGAATLTTDGTVLFCNSRMAEMTAIPVENLLGASFVNILEPDQQYRFSRLLHLATHKSGRLETKLLRPDGTGLPVMLSLSSHAATGTTAVLCLVATDLSEINKMKRGLRETAEVFELAHDAIIMSTLDGYIQSWNRGASDLYGWRPEDAIGKCASELLHTEYPIAFAAIRDILLEKKEWEGELQQRSHSGRLIHVAGRWSIFRDEDGSPNTILEINRDITERVRAEKALRNLNQDLENRVQARTGQLKAINEELESFNYAVAHDLRAPLRHIDGFAKILGEEIETLLDESSRRHLQLIQQSATHMGTLIDELLNLSRAGRRELQTGRYSLSSLVREVVASFKGDIAEREVEWRIGELPSIDCDLILMKQVLVNLVSNALKFTVHRHPAIIEIGHTPMPEGGTRIFVRDNGVGFNMSYAAKLFGVFQRLHRQEDFQGTGVGLAIVQRIMHRHGGKAWAESQPNAGATFYLDFEAGEASGRQPQEQQEEHYA